MPDVTCRFPWLGEQTGASWYVSVSRAISCRHTTAHRQRPAGAVDLQLKGSSVQDHRRNRESVAPRQILFADGGTTLQAGVVRVKVISSWTEQSLHGSRKGFLFQYHTLS
jgi:hypothetical protein